MTKTLKQIHQELVDHDFFTEKEVSYALNSDNLLLTFHAFGDLPVILVVGEKQILIEVALVERDEFARSADIDYQLLTTHKYLPLSTVAIEKINGIDWYVLFNALSIQSKTSVLIEELEELVSNTFVLIDTLEPLYKFNKH